MGRLWEMVEGLDTKPSQRPPEQAMPPKVKAQDPRARLVALLTTWATMDEAQWTHEAVDHLKDQILDVFRDHPTEADGWFRAWRAMHPAAKLT